MKVKCLTVGQMSENCYLLWDKERNTIIIDPGDDADYIIQTIREEELTPSAIIATHGHFDHILAVLELKLAYKIPFYMHGDDEFLLSRMAASAKRFTGFDPGPAPAIDVYLKENSELKIGNLTLKIMSTPGHTPGSICIYSKPYIFSGDLIFEDGTKGEASHKYSDPIKLLKSIKKLSAFEKETIVYPGHGESFKLSDYFMHQ